MQDFYPWWSSKLGGKRMTGPRKHILRYLSQESEFRSAEEIYQALYNRCPSIGLTTVYRTLSLLTDMGMLVKLDSGDGTTRYRLALNSDESRHYHVLVCRSCSRIIRYSEIPEEEEEFYRRMEKAIQEKMGFSVEKHLVQYQGLCPDCNS
jgi:Fur family transcriptional regulator, ferric uptake regulator